MVPVLFMGKKNGKKHMIQDYHYLNEWTVKNLQWSYNNIQIKEENEWKVAFTTLKEVFEPMVMFFRLTNSPAMF